MGIITIEKFLNYKKIKDIKELITEKQYIEIEKVFLYYDTLTIKNRLQNIRDFIINNVEDRWLGRMRIITRKLKNDILSEYACKIRYGEKWEEKRNEVKDKVRMDKKNFIKKYGEEVGVKKWEERNKKVISYGLSPAILRYGIEEGKKRWSDTLNRKIKTMSERKLIRPYRNGRTLVEYQERYGIELGYKKWVLRNNRQSYRFSLNFYIETYGENEGVKKWEEYCESMSKTTLNSFINRYGNEVGTERYNNFVDRCSYTQSERYYIEQYGDVIGGIKYKELIVSKMSNFKDSYSKISQDLFWEIYSKISNDERIESYFYELNYEYTFYVWENGMTIIRVDFKLRDKIIEFDGDYWHSKQEQMVKDKIRDEYLTGKGYFIKRVKESEYRANKEHIINECLNFLKNK
jgi:hypothetical protein